MSEKQQYLNQLAAEYQHHLGEWRKHGCPAGVPRERQIKFLSQRIEILRPLKVLTVENGCVDFTHISEADMMRLTVPNPRERITGVAW